MAKLIIDKSPAILFRRMAGDDPRLVYVSENISRFGYGPVDFLSGRIQFKDIVHPDDRERIRAEIAEYDRKDVEDYTQHYRIVTRNGDVRWIEDQTSVVRDARGLKKYNQGIVVDVTERKLVEIERRRNEEKYRRIVETAGEGFLMMDDNLKIVDVNDAYCRMLGYPRSEILGKTPLDLATEPFREFMTTNKEQLLAKDYRRFEGTLVAKDGHVVPVLINGNTLRDDAGQKIGNVAFVADLTEQKIALRLAGRVQRSLIPSASPQIRGFDIVGRSDSCDEVGGDYFDYLPGSDHAAHRLKIVVGDISGHGVDAALLMTAARAFIRSRSHQPGSPAQLVSRMNRDLALDMGDSGHFMTLFYLEIDPHQHTAHWIRAGHEPALVYKPADDQFKELVGEGLPLGVDANYAYNESPIERLPAGTILALATDGIWETEDSRGQIFGKSRFRDVIRDSARETATTILNNVFDEIKRFSRGLPPQDDITLVIVKVDPAD